MTMDFVTASHRTQNVAVSFFGSSRSHLISAIALLMVGWGFCLSCPQLVEAQDLAASRMIDTMIAAKWKENGFTPAPVCSDADFIRRAYLDIVGVIPPPDEVEKFLKDKDPEKRTKLTDSLLNHPLYAENWANVWEVILIGRRTPIQGIQRPAVREWLRGVFVQNMPYDEFAHQVITARDNGGAAMFAKYKGDPADVATAVSRIFLGVRLQCARCHNHVFEKWKQEDFWSFAAFFQRTKVQGGQAIDVADGETTLNGKVLYPRFITGEYGYSGEGGIRRENLARLVTSPKDPYFAPAIVNRLWGHFFGRGFVEPVDDFRELVPPSHPELLQKLSEDFVAHSHDLKYLMRVIVNSKTYQLSSTAPHPPQSGEEAYFTRAAVRPLSPEQLFYSMMQAADLEGMLRARQADNVEQMKQQYLDRFIIALATDEKQESAAFENTVPQALMMINGQFLNQAISGQRGGALSDIARNGMSEKEKVRQLFLRTVAREPDQWEYDNFTKYLRGQWNGVTLAIGKEVFKTTVLNPAAARARPGGLAGVGFDILMSKNRSHNPYGVFGVFGSAASAAEKKRKENVQANVQRFEDLFWALVNSSEFIYNR